jgi:hypothetical protein
MPKDEVKARLAPIPVYTVANPKNEFVLVAGEVRAWLCTVTVADVLYCCVAAVNPIVVFYCVSWWQDR